MELKIIKLDYNVVIARIDDDKKILLVTNRYDKKGMVSAFDLEGNEFKVEPDLAGFDEKTGEGWLNYWIGNRHLECAYENLEVHKVMKKMGIKINDRVSMETLKKFERAMNVWQENDNETL